MTRLLLYLAVFGAVGYALYNYVLRPRSVGADLPARVERIEPSAPKQTIDNARRVAREIEQDTQRRADEMLDKAK